MKIDFGLFIVCVTTFGT